KYTSGGSHVYSVAGLLNGCTSSLGSVSVTINEPPTTAVISTADTHVCALTSYNIVANTPVSGVGVWSKLTGGGSIADINNSSTSISGMNPSGDSVKLIWTITSGVCLPSRDTLTILVRALPVINKLTAVIGSDSCGANVGYINNVSYTSNAPGSLNYSWKNINNVVVANTPNLNGVSAGKYYITITNANGCVATDSLVVPQVNCIPIMVNNSVSVVSGGVVDVNMVSNNIDFNDTLKIRSVISLPKRGSASLLVTIPDSTTVRYTHATPTSMQGDTLVVLVCDKSNVCSNDTLFIAISPSYPSVSDSLKLVSLYNSITGNKPSWNLLQPVYTWQGVYLSNGLVKALDLSNVGMTSVDAVSLTAFDNLDSVLLNENSLTIENVESIETLADQKNLNVVYGTQRIEQASVISVPYQGSVVLTTNVSFSPNRTFQWQFGNVNIPGANGTSLTLTNLQPQQSGLYSVVITLSNIEAIFVRRPYDVRVFKAVSISDSLALVQIYFETGGNAWSPSRWDLTKPVATWAGVRTEYVGNNFDTMRVTEIVLPNNNLRGTFSLGFTRLTHLRELEISSNRISDTIPSQIGNLLNLKTFSASENMLTGRIPVQIGNMINLTTIALASNRLTSIPSSIGNLTNLRTLDLGNNRIEELPHQIGNLVNLTTLTLNDNALRTLPSSIGNLVSLTRLNLRQNFIESLPSTMAQLTNLVNLQLGDNRLTALGFNAANLNNLRAISVVRNFLSHEDFVSLGDTNRFTIQYDYNPQNRQEPFIDTLLPTKNMFAITTGLADIAGNVYRWYKDSILITPSVAASLGITGFHSPVLVIDSIKLAHRGIYECRITNTLIARQLEVKTRAVRVNVFCLESSSPKPIITTDDDTVYCSSTRSMFVTLRAPKVSGYSYAWKRVGEERPLFGGDTDSYTAFRTGQYYVTITDAFGCSNHSNVITIKTRPIPTVRLDTLSRLVLRARTSTSNGLFKWYKDGVQIPNKVDSILSVKEFGTYHVIVTDTTDGLYCASELSNAYVLDAVSGVEDESAETKVPISIYPNPNDGRFFIEFKNFVDGEIKVIIFTSTGQVLKMSSYENVRKLEVDIRDNPTGVYLLEIQTSFGKYFRRINKSY
ncbi:MAG: leucine-rich repeat domain-containing protein, partial [Cytophagales bacterium]|nr:leucine-rich repeat domain-containing protein [Cytophagales bacterium]MDW8384082.1 leucine-rich repeat domain-containing protein [Flammeovirgaceae bacterium]